MDKLRAMTFFCRVVEHGSFAAAAQSLAVVPSAVSKTIAALEQGLGFSLLHRSTRAIAPTEEGAAYYERCREILQDIEDADAMGRSGTTHPKGTLRVGMHPALRFALLSRMGVFLNRFPELKVETIITNSLAAVIEDGLDLVLHIGPLADSSLMAKKIGWTRPVVCASPGYLAAHGRPQHPRELAGHLAVVYARRDEEATTRWSFRRGGETCEVDVPARLVSRDGVGVVDAAVGGAGIAQPLDISAGPWLRTGELKSLFEDWSVERQAIAAVMPVQRQRVSAKVRVFVEYLSGALDAGAWQPQTGVKGSPSSCAGSTRSSQ